MYAITLARDPGSQFYVLARRENPELLEAFTAISTIVGGDVRSISITRQLRASRLEIIGKQRGAAIFPDTLEGTDSLEGKLSPVIRENAEALREHVRFIGQDLALNWRITFTAAKNEEGLTRRMLLGLRPLAEIFGLTRYSYCSR